MVRKAIGAVILLGVLLLAGVVYLKTQFPNLSALLLGESRQSIFEFDESLITSDMLMLAHLDQAMLRELDSEAASLALQNLSTYLSRPAKALLFGLQESKGDVDSWTFSAYLGEGNTLVSMAIMRGVFDAEALLRALKQSYTFQTRRLDKFTVHDLLALETDGACEEQRTMSLYMTSEYAIVADSVLMDRMLPLMTRGLHSGEVQQDWRLFSEDKLASLWLQRAERLEEIQNVDDPLLAQLLAVADSYMPSFSNLYLGVGVDVIAGKGLFSLQAKSKNDKFASFSIAKWQAYTAQQAGHLEHQLPHSYELLAAMPLNNEQAVVRGALAFERALFSVLPTMFVELIDFLLLNSAPNTWPGDLTPESTDVSDSQGIDTSPRRYFRDFGHENLAPYNVERYGAADAVSGPFGLRLARVFWDEKNEVVSLSFSVSGQVSNLGDQAVRANLSMVSMTDAQGEHLMAVKQCAASVQGQYRASFRGGESDDVVATLVVPLRENHGLDDVKHIKAKVELSLPSQVKRQRVALPRRFPHTVRIAEGSLLTLHDVNGRHISYSVSGQATTLLELRALNRDGDILKRRDYHQNYRYDSMGVIESSYTYSIFQGEVEGLEFVVAKEQLTKAYLFDLDLAQLRAKAVGHRLKQEPKLPLSDKRLFERSQRPKSCEKGTVLTGPLCLGVFAMAVQPPGYRVSLSLPEEAYALNLVSQVSLRLMDDKGGEQQMYWPVLNREGASRGLSADIFVPLSKQKASLRGRLIVRETKDSEILTLSELRLGQTIGHSRFKAQLVEKDAYGGYVLRVTQGADHLLMLVGRDKLWRPLMTKIDKIEPLTDHVRVKFNVEGRADHLDLYIAVQQQEHGYEFSLSD